MKKYTSFYWMFPILIAVLVGCTTTKAETVDETSGNSRNTQAEQDESARKQEQEAASYRSSMETDLRENKLRIAELKQAKTDLNQKAMEERIAQIETLQKRNDALESRMNDYKSDNKEEWKAFKKEFNTEMEDLRKAFKSL